MSTPAYAALEKQVQILRNASGLTPLCIRLLEISLEGMKVPPATSLEIVQEVIQRGRDQMMARRAAEGGDRAAP